MGILGMLVSGVAAALLDPINLLVFGFIGYFSKTKTALAILAIGAYAIIQTFVYAVATKEQAHVPPIHFISSGMASITVLLLFFFISKKFKRHK